jgi:c-di-GMP-binding flagellar brake protein YcgR
MSWNGLERRRGSRVSLDAGANCRLVMRARVKLLDVSAGGALISADTVLPTASVGQMRAALITGSFTPVIEVLRQNPSRHPDRRELGVRFQSMDDHSREQLEGFLKRAAE